MEKREAGKKASLAKYIWMLAAPAMASVVSAVMFIILAVVMAGRGYTVGYYRGDGLLAGLFVTWIIATIALVIAAMVFYIIGLVKISKIKDGEGENSGLATAGFVLGICGVPILALIFGAISFSKKAKNRGMATGALIMGASSTAAGIFWVIVGVVMVIMVADSSLYRNPVGVTYDSYYCASLYSNDSELYSKCVREIYGEIEDGFVEEDGGDEEEEEEEDDYGEYSYGDAARISVVENVYNALFGYAERSEGRLPEVGSYRVGNSNGEGFEWYLWDVDDGMVIDDVNIVYRDSEKHITGATMSRIEVVRSAECKDEYGSGGYFATEQEQEAAIFVQLSDGKYYCEDYY